MGKRTYAFRVAPFGVLALFVCAELPASGAGAQSAPAYEILIDEERPREAEIRLSLARSPAALLPARDGDGSGIANVRCSDGRPASRAGNGWSVPVGCTALAWTVQLDEIDANGLDASRPVAAWSRQYGYWLIPERDALLRASGEAGTVVARLRRAGGADVELRLSLPSNDQPPFYAVIGARPQLSFERDGFTLRMFGAPPAFPWMEGVHGLVLSTWARWRRDLVSADAPMAIGWAWVRPMTAQEPGYNGSAGAEAIVSQIVLRDGDPDAEAKARTVIATSALHEGFHTITGAAGQAWPAWVNESLASHFAVEAARQFLSEGDRRFLNLFFVDPEVRAPLLEAQVRYSAGDGDQAQIFYIHGPRFWREIERVLTNPPNSSGRLAALIRSSNNFAGIDLTDAAAVAAFLDRHSDGRAGPLVRCFLLGRNCSEG